MPPEPAPIHPSGAGDGPLAAAVAEARELDRAGTAITFTAVAAAAGISRSWLYTQPDLRAGIERHPGRSRSISDAIERYPSVQSGSRCGWTK